MRGDGRSEPRRTRSSSQVNEKGVNEEGVRHRGVRLVVVHDEGVDDRGVNEQDDRGVNEQRVVRWVMQLHIATHASVRERSVRWRTWFVESLPMKPWTSCGTSRSVELECLRK